MPSEQNTPALKSFALTLDPDKDLEANAELVAQELIARFLMEQWSTDSAPEAAPQTLGGLPLTVSEVGRRRLGRPQLW